MRSPLFLQLAQPIRFLLEYTGTKFNDKAYSCTGEAPNWDRSSWTDVKPTIGLDFPNLPYYIDGRLMIYTTFTKNKVWVKS